jgi:putative transposase
VRRGNLSLQWYRHRVEATVAIEQWRQFFNNVRPHSSLDYRTPTEFKEQIKIQSGCLGENPEGAVLQE